MPSSGYRRRITPCTNGRTLNARFWPGKRQVVRRPPGHRAGPVRLRFARRSRERRNLYANVPDGAFKRRAEQQLRGSEIPSSPIDQRWRVRGSSVFGRGRIKSALLHPAVHVTSVLPRAKVRRRMPSAWKQKVVCPQTRGFDPCVDGFSRGSGDLELNWSSCLLLKQSPTTLRDRHGTRHGRLASRDRSREAHYQCQGRTALDRGCVHVFGAGLESPRCP